MLSMLLGLGIVALAFGLGVFLMIVANNNVQQFRSEKYVNFIAQKPKSRQSIPVRVEVEQAG